MIRYELRCANGDEFEAWFVSIADYDRQAEAGLVECPMCGSKHVEKAPMAPAVRTSRSKEAQRERAVAMAMAAKVRDHIKENFDYVGDKFADEARKMHAGGPTSARSGVKRRRRRLVRSPRKAFPPLPCRKSWRPRRRPRSSTSRLLRRINAAIRGTGGLAPWILA